MGGGWRAKIAGIADIARHRRDRKDKTLPLINTDDTDQKLRSQAGVPVPQKAQHRTHPSKGGNTRGIAGMGSTKTFRILVEGWGKGTSSFLRLAAQARRASFRRICPDRRTARCHKPSASRRYVFPPASWRSSLEATGWRGAQGGRRSRKR